MFALLLTTALTLAEPVPDFTLKDIHRRPRSLANFAGRKAFVVVFLGTECPLANR